ncbi:hypothetical protein D3C75_340060 [compost metagenome]
MTRLYKYDLDDAQTDHLLKLARTHLQLVKEHVQVSTTPERRKAIRNEIEALRAEHEALLSLSVEHTPIYMRI